MRTFKILSVIFVLWGATIGFSQSAAIKGKVVDASGLVMPGAQIKVSQGNKVVAEVKSGATGDFSIPVAPGDYKIEVSAPDFQVFSENLRVAPNAAPLTVAMKLESVAQTVNVTEDANKVNVDADSSLNATVLNQDFIDQLPNDENDLANYLASIAGTRGDASNTANFIIDGFTGGVMPPKDQIQEVRINNNPYSTEFAGIGFGRVEIITRAGTGTYHGSANFNFRDARLDAETPFTSSKPPYQQRNFNSVFSGPLIRNKLTVNINLRNNDNNAGDSINAFDPQTGLQFSKSVLKPQVNRAFNNRGQLALTHNNTLYFNVNYDSGNAKNQGIGQFNLESRATTRTSSGLEVQIRELAVISTKLVHEVRFEYGLDKSNTTSLSQAFSHSISEVFTDGGAQQTSDTRQRNFEFQNLLMYSGTRWTMRAGFQGRYRRNHSYNLTNFVGSCSFASLQDFQNNTPTVCTQNRGNPLLDDGQFEAGLFMQNDLKINRSLTFSFGTRYQAQTNIGDHKNLDPRVALAYGIGQNTVVRVGAGLFHQRLDMGTFENLLRLDGTHQLQIVVQPAVYDPNNPTAVFGGATAAAPASIRTRASDAVTPYAVNTSVSLERSLPKGLGMTLSWDSGRGVHLWRNRNINAPLPGSLLRPDPANGNLNQLESTGFSRSNNYTLGIRESARNRWNLTLFGNYTLGWSRNDTDGPFSTPMNNYDLRSDWGRSPQDTRHRFFTGASFTVPFAITVNTNVAINSGRPYNIITGRDDNGDTNINDRPAATSRNSGLGPGNAIVGLNFNKSIKLRGELKSGGGSRSPFMSPYAQPQERRDGGPGGPPPPPPLQGGGDRGGGDRPQPNFSNSINPTVNFQVNVNNLLNSTQLGQYIGTLTSPLYGTTNVARNPRTIEVGLRFNF